MSARTRETFHAGLTPERIIDIAVELTEESQLLGWSIRDLATRLGVAPSVIYHHVGGKDVLARRVVERVTGTMVAPDAELEWDDWFRTVLGAARPIALRYPGVAKWLLMHGPAFPGLVPIVDAGVAVLQRAGFGERAGVAYTVLFNSAILLLSLRDERLQHEEDGPRDHAVMMQEFSDDALRSPGVTALTAVMEPFAAGGDEAMRGHRAHFDLTVEVVISGVRAQLLR